MAVYFGISFRNSAAHCRNRCLVGTGIFPWEPIIAYKSDFHFVHLIFKRFLKGLLIPMQHVRKILFYPPRRRFRCVLVDESELIKLRLRYLNLSNGCKDLELFSICGFHIFSNQFDVNTNSLPIWKDRRKHQYHQVKFQKETSQSSYVEHHDHCKQRRFRTIMRSRNEWFHPLFRSTSSTDRDYILLTHIYSTCQFIFKIDLSLIHVNE